MDYSTAARPLRAARNHLVEALGIVRSVLDQDGGEPERDLESAMQEAEDAIRAIKLARDRFLGYEV